MVDKDIHASTRRYLIGRCCRLCDQPPQKKQHRNRPAGTCKKEPVFKLRVLATQTGCNAFVKFEIPARVFFLKLKVMHTAFRPFAVEEVNEGNQLPCYLLAKPTIH